jgi:hypothetical protein
MTRFHSNLLNALVAAGLFLFVASIYPNANGGGAATQPGWVQASFKAAAWASREVQSHWLLIGYVAVAVFFGLTGLSALIRRFGSERRRTPEQYWDDLFQLPPHRSSDDRW